MKKKVIEINTESDKALSAIFDAALKRGGMQMYALVNQIVASIQELGEDE